MSVYIIQYVVMSRRSKDELERADGRSLNEVPALCGAAGGHGVFDLFTPSTHLELEEIIFTSIHDVTDLKNQREGAERGIERMRREDDKRKEV